MWRVGFERVEGIPGDKKNAWTSFLAELLIRSQSMTPLSSYQPHHCVFRLVTKTRLSFLLPLCLYKLCLWEALWAKSGAKFARQAELIALFLQYNINYATLILVWETEVIVCLRTRERSCCSVCNLGNFTLLLMLLSIYLWYLLFLWLPEHWDLACPVAHLILTSAHNPLYESQ